MKPPNVSISESSKERERRSKGHIRTSLLWLWFINVGDHKKGKSAEYIEERVGRVGPNGGAELTWVKDARQLIFRAKTSGEGGKPSAAIFMKCDLLGSEIDGGTLAAQESFPLRGRLSTAEGFFILPVVRFGVWIGTPAFVFRGPPWSPYSLGLQCGRANRKNPDRSGS